MLSPHSYSNNHKDNKERGARAVVIHSIRTLMRVRDLFNIIEAPKVNVYFHSDTKVNMMKHMQPKKCMDQDQ